jgi:hypothetical protein
MEYILYTWNDGQHAVLRAYPILDQEHIYQMQRRTRNWKKVSVKKRRLREREENVEIEVTEMTVWK